MTRESPLKRPESPSPSARHTAGKERRTRASGLAAIQGVLVRNKDDGSVFFFLFFKQKKKISLKIFVVVVKKKLFLLLSLE